MPRTRIVVLLCTILTSAFMAPAPAEDGTIGRIAADALHRLTTSPEERQAELDAQVRKMMEATHGIPPTGLELAPQPTSGFLSEAVPFQNSFLFIVSGRRIVKASPDGNDRRLYEANSKCSLTQLCTAPTGIGQLFFLSEQRKMPINSFGLDPSELHEMVKPPEHWDVVALDLATSATTVLFDVKSLHNPNVQLFAQDDDTALLTEVSTDRATMRIAALNAGTPDDVVYTLATLPTGKTFGAACYDAANQRILVCVPTGNGKPQANLFAVALSDGTTTDLELFLDFTPLQIVCESTTGRVAILGIHSGSGAQTATSLCTALPGTDKTTTTVYDFIPPYHPMNGLTAIAGKKIYVLLDLDESTDKTGPMQLIRRLAIIPLHGINQKTENETP